MIFSYLPKCKASAPIKSLVFIFTVGLSQSILADNFQAFTADSFTELKSDFAGQEFLLGLWSVDCPPCLLELKMMGKILELNPGLPFVLVSTDAIDTRDDAIEFLFDFNLHEIKSWMFADSFVEKLRYSIDPSWYGELPRSYFFDESHNMESHSGIMTEKLLRDWFEDQVLFE